MLPDMIQPYQSRIHITLVYHASKMYYIIIVSVLMLCVVLLHNDQNLNVLLNLILYLCIYHVNGQVWVKLAIVQPLF